MNEQQKFISQIDNWRWVSIGASIFILFLAIIFFEAVKWKSLNIQNMSMAHVGGVVSAFATIAFVIERAGQVAITIGSSKESKDAKISINKNRQLLNQLDQRLIALEAVPNSVLEQAGPDALTNRNDNYNEIAEKRKEYDEALNESLQKLAGQEKKGDKLSFNISLPLAALVTLSGFHLIESLITTEALKPICTDGSNTDCFEPIQMSIFTGIDIFLTTLLLAGGSAGIREILKIFDRTLRS